MKEIFISVALFICLLGTNCYANANSIFTGEARWQSSQREGMLGTCSSLSEHAGSNRNYRWIDDSHGCERVDQLGVSEFSSELLGAVNNGQQGILNGREVDPFWKDSRQFGELLRVVAIKRILLRHQQLLGSPMVNIDSSKCYQFNQGIQNVNAQLGGVNTYNRANKNDHPLSIVRQHQLVFKAKKIKELISQINEIKNLPNDQKMRVRLTSGRYSRASYQNTPEQLREIENLESEINNLLGTSPFLLLDRESEICLFNCSGKMFENQPWIERVSRMTPGSSELMDTIKYFIHKTSTSLRKTVHSLCQVYSDEGRHNSRLQNTYLSRTLRFLNPNQACRNAVSSQSTSDPSILYLQRKIASYSTLDSEEKENINKLAMGQCESEKPFGWPELYAMDDVVDEVTSRFGFSRFSECFRGRVESFSNFSSNISMAVGLGCLASAGVMGPFAIACGAFDVGLIHGAYRSARSHHNQISSCQSAPRVCSQRSVKSALRAYQSSRTDLILSILGEGAGAAIELTARATRVNRALELTNEIERHYAHLPYQSMQKINQKLDQVKNLPYSEKQARLNDLLEDAKEIRELQDNLLREYGNRAHLKYPCLFNRR